MDLLWDLQPSTAAKHRLYQRYLDAWWPKLLQPAENGWRRQRVTYVDAFAGPGLYNGGEDGSPIFVLRRLLEHGAVERMALSRERVRLVFIERDTPRFEHLHAWLEHCFGPLEDLPVRVEVRRGDAGRDTVRILDEIAAWGHPILAIFDSWGNVNVPLAVMERIARNRSSEVIVTFGPNWFNRREAQDAAQLDAVFGGREHWRASDPTYRSDERWRVWLETYRRALRRVGFPYQLSFEVVPRTGQPLHLVFGTKHEKGVEVMKDAMWLVDGEDGMSFRDPKMAATPEFVQESLFDLPNAGRTELLGFVRGQLAGGPKSLASLRDWLLLETSRWRRKDANDAIRELLLAGEVDAMTSGRLTGKSVIKLR